MRNEKQGHHIDHNVFNNAWYNILFLPTKLHTYANYVKSFWIARDRKWMKENPYTISKETGLSLEDILLILRREPDAKMYIGGTVLDAYEVAGQWIAFEMMDPDFRDRMVERGKQLRRHAR